MKLFKKISFIGGVFICSFTTSNAQFIAGAPGTTILTNIGDKVGIGIATPTYKLDISSGDLNIASSYVYRIGGTQILSNGPLPGNSNIFVGQNAGQAITVGASNSFLGYEAGYSTTNGINNVYVGLSSGRFNTSGGSNVCVGHFSGGKNITGTGSTCIGEASGFNSTASFNTYVGYYSGINTLGGGGNTSLGANSASSNTTGTNNTYIGAGADGAATLTNATAIGYNANVLVSNSVVLGSNANIGIGTSAPTYKLHVEGGNVFFKQFLFVGDAPYYLSNFAFRGREVVLHDITGTPGTTQTCAGGFNNRGDQGDIIGIGGQGLGSSNRNYGVQGVGRGTCGEGTSSAFGVYGIPYAAKYNYGLYGEVNAESASLCTTGVFHAVHGEASNVYPGSANYWAGYFNGDFYYSGAWKPSDQKLKENVKDISSAMDRINMLKPRSYNYLHTEELKGLALPYGESMGFIAQELETVFPNLVKATINPAVMEANGEIKYPEVSFTSVDYISLIPILTAGIQEQQKTIDAQQESINKLNEQLALLKNNTTPSLAIPNSTTSSINTLSDDQSALFQNQPNPFKDNTTIEYYLTSKTQKASIFIFDMNGTLLKTFSINQSGKGSINISGGEFKAGMYIYSLIVDNKEIDSKRMILVY